MICATGRWVPHEESWLRANSPSAELDLVFNRTIFGNGFGARLDEKGRLRMQDALMLLFTVIFFAVAFLYVKACQKLR